MKRFKMKPKILLLAAIVLLFPTSVIAQNGMFQRGVPDETHYGKGNTNGLMNRSESAVGGCFTGQGFGVTDGNLTGQGFGVTNGNITGQTFGTPLGGGLFVMLVAGASYATIKSRKKQKQNQNRKGK